MADVILISEKKISLTLHYLNNDSLMRQNGSLLSMHTLLLYLYSTTF